MVDIIIQIIITIGAWLILMVISTNLVGFFVRGLLSGPVRSEGAAEAIIAKENQKSRWSAMLLSTFLFVALISALYVYGTLGLILGTLMLMVARVPDVIWEHNNGRGLEMEDMNKPRFPVLTAIISWSAIPVIWYGLYRM